MWEWVKLLLTAPMVLLWERELERLLGLYLSGGFPREMLTGRKTRLEATVGALKEEGAGWPNHPS